MSDAYGSNYNPGLFGQQPPTPAGPAPGEFNWFDSSMLVPGGRTVYRAGYAPPVTTPQTDLSGLGYASVGSGLVGAGLSAYGAYAAGEAQADAYRFSQKLAGIQAAQALRIGRIQEQRYRLGARQFIGSQRAALAAQGADLSSGTALRLQTDSSYIAEIDARTLKNNAALAAFGFRAQAVGFGQQASDAQSRAFGQVAATSLTGIGNSAYSVYAQRSAGVFG